MEVKCRSPFDKFFDDLLWNIPAANGHYTANWPEVDIDETNDSYKLVADLPGVDEKDIDIKVEDGYLILSGKRESSTGTETHRERRDGAFFRRFRLTRSVDTDNIHAAYKNGVLTVTLPKIDTSRTIPIKLS